MDLLTELGIKYNTDKATDHHFTQHYDKVFNPIRCEVKNILEIGVWEGASIYMWLDYFPNAVIHCIDIADREYLFYEATRVKFKRVSCLDYKPTEIFDIIIDDGSHFLDHQQITFNNLNDHWSRYYVLEDLHTSYEGWDNKKKEKPGSTVQFLKGLTNNYNIDFINENDGCSLSSIISRI